MAQTFSFGFFGEDIDNNDADARHGNGEMQIDGMDEILHNKEKQEPELLSPRKHTLEGILSSLPSSLSYNTLSIPFVSLSEPAPSRQHARSIDIPKRSLFDVVAQLKAESDISPGPRSDTHNQVNKGSNTNNANVSESGSDYEMLIATLESGDDLRSRIYEGGFKTWECAVDLASYLASCLDPDQKAEGGDPDWEWRLTDPGLDAGSSEDNGENEGQFDGFDIIELGAGSAIPSLVVLNHILKGRCRRPRTSKNQEDNSGGRTRDKNTRDRATTRFVLCDYNIEVLRLVTGANVLLQLVRRNENSNMIVTDHHDENLAAYSMRQEVAGEGELDLDLNIHQASLSTLTDYDTSIDLISGAWGDEFVDLIIPPPSSVAIPAFGHLHPHSLPHESRNRPLLILSSETLYSPSSLQTFVHTLLSLLERSRRGSLALVSSKILYFGVGGGIDAFISEVMTRGAVVEAVREIDGNGLARRVRGQEGSKKEGRSKGVGRIILKVSLSNPSDTSL